MTTAFEQDVYDGSAVEFGEAIGFDKELRPILADAISARHVDWIVRPVSDYGVFDYLGFRYVVRRDSPLARATVRKTCQLDVSEDGETVIARDLEAERQQAAYSENWGAF